MTFPLDPEAFEALRDVVLAEEWEREWELAQAPVEHWGTGDLSASPDWEEQSARGVAEFRAAEYERVIEMAPWESIGGLAKIALRERALRAAQAEELYGLARLWRTRQEALPVGATGKDVELAQRILASELSVVLGVSDRTVMGRIAEAELLTTGYPKTLAALHRGEVAVGHVRVIADAGAPLDENLRGAFETAVLEHAVDDHGGRLTPGRLRVVAKKLATELGQVSATERHESARERRRVLIEDLPDGMARLLIEAPAPLIAAVHDRLTRQTTALKAACEQDERSYDQIRTDLALELMLTADPTGREHAALDGIRAHVAITIPALTLLGKGTEPATMATHGPIDLDTATRLAAGTPEWVRVLTDPITRVTITADTYRPPPKLRAILYARDGRCRFPTCNATPLRGDIDHVTGWNDGGKTTPDNLACLCRGHHTLKSIGAWKVTTDPHGTLTWTSPNGITTTDTIHHPVAFA